MGAKGKYKYWLTPEGLGKLVEWARDGLSDKDIYTNIGISKDTFYQWYKLYADFSDTLTRGRSQSTNIIENAIFLRAQTQIVRVKKPIKIRIVEYDDKGKKKCEREEVQLVEQEEVIPGDTKAAQLWLINRRSEKWREKPEPAPEKPDMPVVNVSFKGLKREGADDIK